MRTPERIAEMRAERTRYAMPPGALFKTPPGPTSGWGDREWWTWWQHCGGYITETPERPGNLLLGTITKPITPEPTPNHAQPTHRK